MNSDDADAPLFLHLANVLINAFFIDVAQRAGADFEFDFAVQFRHKKSLLLQIGQKAALGFNVGVGNAVPPYGALARQLAYSRHGFFSSWFIKERKVRAWQAILPSFSLGFIRHSGRQGDIANFSALHLPASACQKYISHSKHCHFMATSS